MSTWRCCDSLGVPNCIFKGFILKIASHMRVGLYVSDMGNTLPETNIAPEKMLFLNRKIMFNPYFSDLFGYYVSLR